MRQGLRTPEVCWLSVCWLSAAARGSTRGWALTCRRPHRARRRHRGVQAGEAAHDRGEEELSQIEAEAQAIANRAFASGAPVPITPQLQETK